MMGGPHGQVRPGCGQGVSVIVEPSLYCRMTPGLGLWNLGWVLPVLRWSLSSPFEGRAANTSSGVFAAYRLSLDRTLEQLLRRRVYAYVCSTRKSLVPQMGQVPWVAGRPFFNVTACEFLLTASPYT